MQGQDLEYVELYLHATSLSWKHDVYAQVQLCARVESWSGDED